ncbi:MAG: hypothetical protein GX442_05425 [Candidatus Riflebacteria bacterium]|nr:hypothetical protein [Candidatus Riflebacteria bacterium]
MFRKATIPLVAFLFLRVFLLPVPASAQPGPAPTATAAPILSTTSPTPSQPAMKHPTGPATTDPPPTATPAPPQAAGSPIPSRPTTGPTRPSAGPSSPGEATPPSPASADDLLFLPTGTAPLPAFPVPDPLSTTLRILTSLAVVIALVFGLSWFLQRRGPLGGPPIGRVLGILPLDGHRSVYVVDVLGRILLLGVAEQGVSLLGEITDQVVIDGLRVKAERSTIPGLEQVFRFLRRPEAPGPAPAEEPAPDRPDFSQHTRKAQDQARQMEDLLLRRPPRQGD